MCKNFVRPMALIVVLLFGIALGYCAANLNTEANAGVRKSPPRQPVPSGAQQSYVVLQQMASTLKSIDGRLERVETTLQRISVNTERE